MCIYGVYRRMATPSPQLTKVCVVCATRVTVCTVCTVGADRVTVSVASVSASVCRSLAAPFRLADICAACIAHCTIRTVSANSVTITDAGFARLA